MKLLTTAAGSHLTGDDIADAVMELSTALVRAGDDMMVTIPVADGDGTIGLADVIVGRHAPTSAVTRTQKGEELVDPAAVVRLHIHRASVRRRRAVPFEQHELSSLHWPALE